MVRNMSIDREDQKICLGNNFTRLPHLRREKIQHVFVCLFL